MPSILEKAQILFSANMHGMIDRALETNSLKVMDEYIRQVERNLEALEDSVATVGEDVHALKRKYEEFSYEADKLDRDIDTVIMRGKDELSYSDDNRSLRHTKQELAQDYHEQYQSRKEQYQGMLSMRMKLEGRLTTVKQEREKMHSLLELAKIKQIEKLDREVSSGNQEIDNLLNSIYSQINQEDAKNDDFVRPLAKQIAEDKMGIRIVERQLEERKRRLLGLDSDDK